MKDSDRNDIEAYQERNVIKILSNRDKNLSKSWLQASLQS